MTAVERAATATRRACRRHHPGEPVAGAGPVPADGPVRRKGAGRLDRGPAGPGQRAARIVHRIPGAARHRR